MIKDKTYGIKNQENRLVKNQENTKCGLNNM